MVIFKFEIQLINVQFLQEEKGILFDVIVNDNSCLIEKRIIGNESIQVVYVY